MNSISSVAYVIYDGVKAKNYMMITIVKKKITHAEHASHPKSFDLFETPKRLLDQAFDERVERSVEKWWGYFVDLRVHANEVQ